MRDIKIKTYLGYLGKHPRILNPGDTQTMVFSNNDFGPFWMKPKHKIVQKYDIQKPGTKERKYNKQELLSLLKDKIGYEIPPNTHVNIVKTRCTKHQIPLKFPHEPIIKKQWSGKAKGMHQGLWDIGFINKRNRVEYTVDEKKDAFGVKQNGRFLKHLLKT